jgi:2-phosphoglycerate kinase
MEEESMRVRFQGADVPYPLSVIRGRLKLCGLSHLESSSVLDDVVSKHDSTSLNDLLSKILTNLKKNHASVVKDFETLTRYEELRTNQDVPSLVVIMSGASATGKSIIALELVNDMVATRFISSDTVRHVLRNTLDEATHPELFSHTYQAHLHRQSGPEDLDSGVRGFLAQCELVTPHIRSMTERVLSEGTLGVVEGVHVIPGEYQGLSQGVVEVLINPDEESHRAMFSNKHDSGLRTVSEDPETREQEFVAARAIQHYLNDVASKDGIPVITMTNFENAYRQVAKVILDRIKMLVKG